MRLQRLLGIAALALPLFGAGTSYRTANVDGVKVFYREAGEGNKQTIVLLHGFPTSSRMYSELIPLLADRYRVIAPDYPGFGQSEAPPAAEFAYTFDHLAEVTEHLLDQLGLQRYAIYIQDYGSPVGFRLATRRPERIAAIVSQNGNAYDEGLSPFWAEYLTPFWKNRNAVTEAKARQLLSLDSTKLQYQAGERDLSRLNPDAWIADQAGLDRPGNAAIQMALFYDYRNNLPLYESWHQYLRERKPPVLAVWGKNDPIFLPAGATAFQRDVPEAEVHLLHTGHFALQEDVGTIAGLMRSFLERKWRDN